MGRAKKGSGGPAPDPNAWMVTFSDLITLLLTFFVLLMSMSSISSKKLQETFSQFPGAVTNSIIEGGSVTPVVRDINNLSPTDFRVKKETGGKATGGKMDPEQYRALYDWMIEKKLADKIKMIRREDRFEMILENDILFEPGSNEVKKQMNSFLKEISALMVAQNKTRLTIETYATDAREIMDSEKYLTLEDLALARAESLVQALIKRTDIEPGSISMMGYDKPRFQRQADKGGGQWVEFVVQEDMRL